MTVLRHLPDIDCYQDSMVRALVCNVWDISLDPPTKSEASQDDTCVTSSDASCELRIFQKLFVPLPCLLPGMLRVRHPSRSTRVMHSGCPGAQVPPDVAGVFWPCAVGYAILMLGWL